MPGQHNSRFSGKQKPAHHHQQNHVDFPGITALYNFVPLAEQVFTPQDGRAGQVTHDIPFEDGLCGTLALSIRTHTPLLAGESEKDNRGISTVKSYTLPDGTPAIPGSSLRGMVRNVLEIISFGKMGLVDDKRYGIRDLSNKIYQDAFTDKIPVRSKNYKPKSLAGWLSFDEKRSQWIIIPCDHARVESRDSGCLLDGYLNEKWVDLVKGKIDSEGEYRKELQTPVAKDKYIYWRKFKPLTIKFNVSGEKKYPHYKKSLIYKKVTELGVAGEKEGQLVFTGQPNNSKHMEFIFFDEKSTEQSVPESVIRSFQNLRAVHNSDQRDDHWDFLNNNNIHPEGIPVFYLTDNNGAITSLGLSQMYRLSYTNSIGELIAKSSAQHRNQEQCDLAELIFGKIDADNGHNSLKGRVSFSLAKSRKKEMPRHNAYETVLGAPKPTYYPNYILQAENEGVLSNPAYRTYMDQGARIRGWKRYPVRPPEQVEVPELKPDQRNSDAWTKLHPIESEMTLSGRLRFHNLRPVELGALLWVLEWGGDDELRHSLGMGKPFGFGQLSIRVDREGSSLIANRISTGSGDDGDFTAQEPSKSSGGKQTDLAACVAAFEQMMQDWYQSHHPGGDWRYSPQLRQLCAMADPGQAPGQPGSLAYLQLDPKRRINEFVTAKGGRDKPRYVLRAYAGESDGVGSGGGLAAPDSPEACWLNETRDYWVNKHHSKPEEVMRGKLLAQSWSELEDAELKKAVGKLIVAYWKAQDWWDDPRGKSMKLAHKMYQVLEE